MRNNMNIQIHMKGKTMQTNAVPASAIILTPPFTLDTAIQKVRLAEDAWNSHNPEKVSLAYTEDSLWRNRDQFLQGREQIVPF
jgi:nuclear transport factor 2 (NTF2) superfamily protein